MREMMQNSTEAESYRGDWLTGLCFELQDLAKISFFFLFQGKGGSERYGRQKERAG